MIYSVSARDNVTLRGEGECMSYLEIIADLTNDSLERNREVLAKGMSDLMLFGQCTMKLDD